MLTKRQKQVFNYIKQYVARRDYAPSLEEIRQHFNFSSVSTAYFHIDNLRDNGYLDKVDNKARSIALNTKEHLIQVPFLGIISAGHPIEAIENIESIAVPKSKISTTQNVFALRVNGESMVDENIHDGDVVLVKQQPTAENGQKIVALIDKDNATLKKYYKETGGVRLQPANKSMTPIFVGHNQQLDIQGVVLDVIHDESSVTRLPKTEKPTRIKKLPLNQIICGDAVDVLRTMPSNSVDLVVTSPPYDDIRTYNGFSLDLPQVGKEIFRVLKDGGIAVMVIQDSTRNFGKTLTTYRTILDWCDNAGFKLFENVIYRKYGTEGAWWKNRFRVDHEYMPIFLKGEKPAYFNKEPLKILSKHGGKVLTGSGNRRTDGTTTKTVTRMINAMKCRGTVWDYLNAGDKDPFKRKHPATFPDQIPIDFITCFSPLDGVVLDPFIGCGSTAVAAKKHGRNYIGIDVSKEYCDLSEQRLATVPLTLL